MKLMLLVSVCVVMSGCATSLKATGMVLQGFGGGAKTAQAQDPVNCWTYDGGQHYSCQ